MLFSIIKIILFATLIPFDFNKEYDIVIPLTLLLVSYIFVYNSLSIVYYVYLKYIIKKTFNEFNSLYILYISTAQVVLNNDDQILNNPIMHSYTPATPPNSPDYDFRARPLISENSLNFNSINDNNPINSAMSDSEYNLSATPSYASRINSSEFPIINVSDSSYIGSVDIDDIYYFRDLILLYATYVIETYRHKLNIHYSNYPLLQYVKMYEKYINHQLMNINMDLSIDIYKFKIEYLEFVISNHINNANPNPELNKKIYDIRQNILLIYDLINLDNIFQYFAILNFIVSLLLIIAIRIHYNLLYYSILVITVIIVSDTSILNYLFYFDMINLDELLCYLNESMILFAKLKNRQAYYKLEFQKTF